ncbi:MAG: hypothetical protein NTW29_20040 [Bacteroidetes bacterium]|nr:hypothetical protein [Bacteroidota bacterium]
MTFEQQISAYSLGILQAKDLQDLAIKGLEESYDSESLRILAGLSSTENPFILHDYFTKAISELNIQLKDPKDALKDVIFFYAKIIVDKQVDTYSGFDKLDSIIMKTGFDFDNFDLMPCYVEYISIWEEKSDGLDFHTYEGLTKEQYIEKTEQQIRNFLREWLNANDTS